MHLFEALGIELEYMLVREPSLDVAPICDALLTREAGQPDDAEHPDITWSNELALHVVELKVTRPATDLRRAAADFHRHALLASKHLAEMNARLLPTAMHPWMDPAAEFRFWPHSNTEIYAAFHRIFRCDRHGWANLQSMHLNLPFEGDAEFARLHAAVRLVLPLLPALAASSPLVAGRLTGVMDNRLLHYRDHCAAVPSLVAGVIPEPIFSTDEYREKIIEPLYDAIAPHDPEEHLRGEFLNARGAIARLGRGSIEIRLIDVQECPAADLAIAAVVFELLKLLTDETWANLPQQQRWPVAPLASILDRTIHDADRAVIDDADYLRTMGWTAGPCATAELWSHLITEINRRRPASLDPFRSELDVLQTRGPLARRIAAALSPSPHRQTIAASYRQLAESLTTNRMFIS